MSRRVSFGVWCGEAVRSAELVQEAAILLRLPQVVACTAQNLGGVRVLLAAKASPHLMTGGMEGCTSLTLACGALSAEIACAARNRSSKYCTPAR